MGPPIYIWGFPESLYDPPPLWWSTEKLASSCRHTIFWNHLPYFCICYASLDEISPASSDYDVGWGRPVCCCDDWSCILEPGLAADTYAGNIVLDWRKWVHPIVQLTTIYLIALKAIVYFPMQMYVFEWFKERRGLVGTAGYSKLRNYLHFLLLK